MKLTALFYGIAGSSERGWLGWSTIVLLQDHGRNMLFDTGAFNDRPGLLMKLADYHLSPDHIDTVIISHLHFDHIANIDLFKNAVWYIHEEEFKKSDALDNPVPEPYLWWISRQSNLIRVQESRIKIIPGIEIIHTPGHTAGSCSLLAECGKSRILLCADAVKSRKEARNIPSGLTYPDQVIDNVDLLIPGHDTPLLPDGTSNMEIVHWIKTNASLEICNYE